MTEKAASESKKPIILEVGSVVSGVNVTLRTELGEQGNIGEAIKQLTDELKRALGTSASIAQIASVSPAAPMPLGVVPAPAMQAMVPELANLQNAPENYAPADAVLELLDPQTSVWSKQPHTVSEIQERLMQLGVRGISNLQTFDGVMRRMVTQGKIRREKIDGTYKYYGFRREQDG